MIISCPSCAARMQVDPQRLGGKRVTVRCVRCQHVFKTEVGMQETSPVQDRVLVAHSDEKLCATIADILEREKIPFAICHGGEEALGAMEQDPPRVALMDVALPGLYAFEVVEKVRRRPRLEDVKIILLSSVYNKAAYKRQPTSLYGADDYLEKHHIPDKLVPKIRALTEKAGQAGASGPAPDSSRQDRSDDAFLAEVSGRIRAAEDQELRAAAGESGVEKARRLAHIIASDIALYNQERLDAGIRAGDIFSVLREEIAEGHRLFEEKIPSEIRRQEDFLQAAFAALVDRRRRELQL